MATLQRKRTTGILTKHLVHYRGRRGSTLDPLMRPESERIRKFREVQHWIAEKFTREFDSDTVTEEGEK